MITYPVGYGTRLVSFSELKAIHEPKMHPEFAFDLFAWIESKGGLIGIGGGWRTTPHPVSAASMRGESFHQDQTFASGFRGYSAVDLVAKNPGKVHRSPTWAESSDAPAFGVHTFIQGEPWHMQSINMRGYQTWINAGRPDPVSIMRQKEDNVEVLEKPVRKYDSRYYDDRLKQEAGKVLLLNLNVDDDVKGAFVNITVVSPETDGYLTAWGVGENPPEASNVNFKAGVNIANSAFVQLDAGKIRIVTSAKCHILVDLQAITR